MAKVSNAGESFGASAAILNDVILENIAKEQWEKELLAKYRNRCLIDRIAKETSLMANNTTYDRREDDITLTPRGGESTKLQGEVTKFRFYKNNPETIVHQRIYEENEIVSWRQFTHFRFVQPPPKKDY